MNLRAYETVLADPQTGFGVDSIRSRSAVTIEIRPARIDDAGAIATLIRFRYGRSSNPCRDPAFVRRSIGRDAWFVGTVNGEIHLCGAAVALAWPGVYELCRLASAPQPDQTAARHERARAVDLLYSCMVRAARRQPDCRVITGRPRLARTLAMATACADAPLHLAGSDGGMHIIDDLRERHGIAVAANPLRHSHRSRPRTLGAWPPPWTDSCSFTRDETVYPSHVVATPSTDCVDQPTACGGPDDSALLEVDEPTSALDVLDAVAKWRALGRGHVHLFVLADKIHALLALRSLGLTPAAYLPAWWEHGGSAYDCVLVTADRSGIPQHANDLKIVLDEAHRQLDEALSAAFYGT